MAPTVNLQYKKIWWETGKRYVKLRLSTKAIKTIEKNGLDAVAKKGWNRPSQGNRSFHQTDYRL